MKSLTEISEYLCSRTQRLREPEHDVDVESTEQDNDSNSTSQNDDNIK